MAELTTEQVRAEVEDWLDANWTNELTVGEWWRKMADAGYSAPMLPAELGGRGYGQNLAIAVTQAFAARGVIGPPSGLGLMLAAPTIAIHGSPEQQQAWIPPILDGTHAWCQLFSEPGAGSDLAGLRTTAVLDGDEYIVSGQKVWTSGGQHADYGMLLARTNVDVPKHQGITYLLFDMRQPGVEVRPLREMTGKAMFNEVFIDEARVPVANVLGGLNNGWAVANTTLMVERTTLGAASGGGGTFAIPGSIAGQHGRKVGDLVGAPGSALANVAAISQRTVRQYAELARQTGVIDDPVVRQGLAELHILTTLNLWNVARVKAQGANLGVEGNLAKLLMTHTLRRAREIANAVIGADGMLWGPGALSGGVIQELTVYSPAPAIYGGTDQVQRNIVGERGLGLPKEPGDFNKMPFSQLPK